MALSTRINADTQPAACGENGPASLAAAAPESDVGLTLGHRDNTTAQSEGVADLASTADPKARQSDPGPTRPTGPLALNGR